MLTPVLAISKLINLDLSFYQFQTCINFVSYDMIHIYNIIYPLVN